jgi:hypothetical protein
MKIQKLFEVKTLFFVSVIKLRLNEFLKEQAKAPQVKLSAAIVNDKLRPWCHSMVACLLACRIGILFSLEDGMPGTHKAIVQSRRCLQTVVYFLNAVQTRYKDLFNQDTFTFFRNLTNIAEQSRDFNKNQCKDVL